MSSRIHGNSFGRCACAFLAREVCLSLKIVLTSKVYEGIFCLGRPSSRSVKRHESGRLGQKVPVATRRYSLCCESECGGRLEPSKLQHRVLSLLAATGDRNNSPHRLPRGAQSGAGPTRWAARTALLTPPRRFHRGRLEAAIDAYSVGSPAGKVAYAACRSAHLLQRPQ
jgi:hypothetical protein